MNIYNNCPTQEIPPSYFDALFDLSSDILIKYCPKSYKIVAVNKAASDFFGYLADDLETLTLADLGILLQQDSEWVQNLIEHKGLNFLAKMYSIFVSEELYLLNIQLQKETPETKDRRYQLLYNQLQEINHVTRMLEAYSSKKIGDDYFQAIVNGFCKSLGADFAFIAEVVDNQSKANTLYMSNKGKTDSNMVYSLAGTPCANLTDREVCVYLQEVQKLFPEDYLLVEMNIHSYAGIPIYIRDSHKEGSWILVALFSHPIENKGFYEHVLSITAKKIQAEKERGLLLNAVKAREKSYRDLFENANDAIIIVDAVDKRVIKCNHKATELLGYSREELTNLTVFDIRPDTQHSREIAPGLFDELSVNKNIRFEHELMTKDGRIFTVEVSACFVAVNGRKCIQGIIRDMSERIKKDKQLLKSKMLLEKAQEIAKVGSWEFDLNTATHLWSKQHYKIYELAESIAGEQLVKAFTRLVHPDDRGKIDVIVNKAIENKTDFEFPYRLLFPDGRIKYIISKGEILCDHSENPIKVIGTIQDVTIQKQLEEKLAKANEAEFAKLYRQQKIISEQLSLKSKEINRFFELSLDMICIIELDGTPIRINPSFSRILGYSEEEMLTQPLYSFVHPDDLALTVEVSNSFFSGDPITEYENRFITKKGDFRWFAWHSIFDFDSKLIYAIARDITEEKKAYKEIEDLKYTLDQTAIVVVFDSKNRIISVNNKFCETAGFSREEVIGQEYNLFFYDNHNNGHWEQLCSVIRAGEVWRGELISKKKDGHFYWADTSVVPFCDIDGAPFQYIAIQSDITQRKQLEIALRNAKEDALKLANIKENFLANMSHEIRTPMNAILGFSELLVQNELDADLQQEYAGAIHSSAENLLVVINDILDFSKINSGKLELEQIEFNFTNSIHQVIRTLQAALQKKQLAFHLEIDRRIPENIKGASNRISQVLINLLSNAIKFTHIGSITLRVKILENTQQLLFEIIDTGIGIASDKLDYIFESFTQAENYTTRVYGGTGLGLSISKKLVLLMGGEIGVNSNLNQGSTFFFRIPYQAVETTKINKKTMDDEQKNLSFNNLKILVVEDNKLNQKLVKVHLNKFNCQFDLVENGQEAVEYAAANHYDIILMDIQMPVMDGIEATKIIRSQGATVPIIAVTAHALEREKQICFDIGMNDYLSKPFKQEELQRLILKYYNK